MTESKTIVVILGPGASGKSTLTRMLGDVPKEEDKISVSIPGGDESAKYTVFANGFALVGNLKNGTDSVSSMLAKVSALNWLLARPDVHTVIMDGVRCSILWDVEWLTENHEHDQILYVGLDISEEENLRRLANRRRERGILDMSEATISNVRAFRKRAKTVWEAAVKAQGRYSNVRGIVLRDGEPPDVWASKVRIAINDKEARCSSSSSRTSTN